MLNSFARGCALIRSAAIPVLAALVFSFGWAVSPAPDGGLGPTAAEAKSEKAKGGKGGDRKVRTAKSDRKKDRKERTAKKDRKKDRTARTDRKKERTAKQDRKTAKTDRKTERTAKTDRKSAKTDRKSVTETGQDTASVEERREDYWEKRDSRYEDNTYNGDGGETDGDGYDDPDGEEIVAKRNWGATASQLKHRNAANASESAFRNASPNSNVGRIATYREAARATLDKEAAIDDLDRRLDDLHYERQVAEADGDFDRVAEIDAEVLRLEDERHYANDDLDNLRLAEDDAYRAVGGPELDDHDYGVFRRMLGLE